MRVNESPQQSLIELIEAEPLTKWIDLSFSHVTDTSNDHVKPCSIVNRTDYDRLRKSALVLARACERYNSAKVILQLFINSQETGQSYCIGDIATEAITEAREIMEGKG